MLDQFDILMFAYCLMPNHFHLLMKVQKGENLSRGMQWFMTTHVRRYHRHYRSTGHLWGRGATKVLSYRTTIIL
jgi:putative transposase